MGFFQFLTFRSVYRKQVGQSMQNNQALTRPSVPLIGVSLIGNVIRLHLPKH